MRCRLYRRVVFLASVFACGILVFLLPLFPQLGDKTNSHAGTTNKGNFTAVILLTQIRSGSSFTGEVLQQHKDSFYVYEPLRALQTLRKNNRSISFLNGSVWPHDSYDTDVVLYQTLVGWLTCNFSMIYRESLLDFQFLSFGKKTKLFSECISQNNERGPNVKPEHRLLMRCLDQLRTSCLESKYRIIKTIRTPMSVMLNLLRDLHNVKVIHLVRDPRAQVASLKKLGGCQGFIKCVTFLCSNLMDDTEVRLSAVARYPDNFYTLKYESLVQEPLYHFPDVFTFLGIPFTRETRMYIDNLTDPNGDKSQCEVCKTYWQNATSPDAQRHIRGWKNILSIWDINVMQAICYQMLQYYNYSKPSLK